MENDYLNLEEEDLEIDNLGSSINHVDGLCNSVEVRNWKGCSQFRESVSNRFGHLRSSESLLTNTVGRKYEDSRLRRGILNFVGEISKVQLGTLDENNADYYEEQICRFERNSDDTTDLLKQDVFVIKSTLGTLNNTLVDIEHNVKLVRKGLSNIQTYLDTLSSETAHKLDIFEAKLMIEKHITQVNNILTILQRNIDFVQNSVLNAQSGNIQPQIVPPKLLLISPKKNQSFFPLDTLLPFPLSKDATNLNHKVCEMQVYIQNDRLSYVVSVPLVNKWEFKGHHLLPVPIPINKDKPIYIRTAKSTLCVDKTRQYNYFSSDLELQDCKEPTKQGYVCKQNNPLLSSLVE